MRYSNSRENKDSSKRGENTYAVLQVFSLRL